MANPGTLPVTLVTILLLVAPGYLAIRVFLRVAERNDTLDRTAKIVWSSAASLGSLLLLYLASPVYFDRVTDFGKALTESGVVTGETLFGSSLSTGVLLYGSHLLVLFVLTGPLGLADRQRGDDDRDRREPWRYAFDDAGGGQIEVFLENGPHIRGEFDPSAWDSSRKDLYLRDPKSLSDGKPVPLEQSMLIRSEWITGVVFPEDDPNGGLMENEKLSEQQMQILDNYLGSLELVGTNSFTTRKSEINDGLNNDSTEDTDGDESS
ncbi:DUF6338 family protein [Halobaculum sp. MBLA0143]|uniref:DUF6338 family protein n=1 Tax=Halobaculum sp. MBLA0143 TaxID=3079933 RepID=UPI003524EE7B